MCCYAWYAERFWMLQQCQSKIQHTYLLSLCLSCCFVFQPTVMYAVQHCTCQCNAYNLQFVYMVVYTCHDESYLCALHAYIIEMTHVLSIVPLPNRTKSLAQAGEFTPGGGGPQAQPPAKHWPEMACGFQGAWQGNWGAKVPSSLNEMSSWGPRDLPQASARIPSDLELETLSPPSMFPRKWCHFYKISAWLYMVCVWKDVAVHVRQLTSSTFFLHFQFPSELWLRKASGKLAPQIWSVLETRARNWTKCINM